MRALINRRILMTCCQILSLTNCIHIGPQGLRGLCKDGGRGVPDAATQHQLPSDRHRNNGQAWFGPVFFIQQWSGPAFFIQQWFGPVFFIQQ